MMSICVISPQHKHHCSLLGPYQARDKNWCSSLFLLRRCHRLSFVVDKLKPHRFKHNQTRRPGDPDYRTSLGKRFTWANTVPETRLSAPLTLSWSQSSNKEQELRSLFSSPTSEWLRVHLITLWKHAATGHESIFVFINHTRIPDSLAFRLKIKLWHTLDSAEIPFCWHSPS